MEEGGDLSERTERDLARMSSRARLLSQENREDSDTRDIPNSIRRNTNRSIATFKSFATEKSAVETSKSAYIYAIGIALPISLVCFTIQTELAQYIQARLHYEKPYFMLYITHSSWWLNGVGMWCFLKLTNWSTSPSKITTRMFEDVRGTAKTIAEAAGQGPRNLALHMFYVITLCVVCLTIAGGTWYVAVNLTTAADLSAIYNASAFFAYAFSIPILREQIRRDKVIAVALSVIGVFVIAYGDRGSNDEDVDSGRRALGNIIISVGAVLYGLYEVLYKKYGCPPAAYDPNRSIVFANAIATGLGLFTLLIMWIPIPLLHILGWETFEVPPRNAVLALVASVAANFIYSSCLLAMISLTSPVLSSVACLLSIFVVAIVDTYVTGEPLSAAAITGGVLIGVAFALLSWATYVEMQEEALAKQSEQEDADVFDITSDDEDER